MKKIYSISITVIVSLLFTSCLPSRQVAVKQKMPPLSKNENVIVLDKQASLPGNAVFVGVVKIGDSGFSTNCGWNTVINYAIVEARKMGGNVIKITEHKPPHAFGSSCHRIKADIFKVVNTNTEENSNPIDYPNSEANVPTKMALHQPENKLQLGIFGGYSYMTGKISPDVPADLHNYYKKLKSGFHFGLSADYYLSATSALGLYYTFFNTSNSIGITEYDLNTGTPLRTGTMSDNLKIQLIAPTYTIRYLPYHKKLDIAATIGLGYLSYRNDAKLIDPFTLKGGTLGTILGLGGAYKISKSVSANLKIAYIMGSLRKFQYSDINGRRTVELPEGNYESANHLDISVGLKWSLF